MHTSGRVVRQAEWESNLWCNAKKERSESPNRPLKQKSSNAVVIEILIYNPISAHTGQINSYSAMFISLKIISWHSLWGAFNSDLTHRRVSLFDISTQMLLLQQIIDVSCVLEDRRIFQDSLMNGKIKRIKNDFTLLQNIVTFDQFNANLII